MKHFKSIFVAFLCIFILAGCAAPASTPLQEKPSTSENSTPFSNHDLQMVNQPCGASDAAISKDGVYYTSIEGAISYLDESSGNTTVLCNRPECQHADESCTAFVENGACFLFMNPTQDKLFLNYRGVPDAETYYADSQIYSADVNGANRKLLFTLEAGTMQESFAFDGTDLYFVTNDTNPETAQAENHLHRLNTETGAHSIVQTFDRTTILVGGYDQFVLLEHNNGSGGGAVADIVQYDVASGESTAIYHYEANGYENSNPIAYAKNEFLYMIDPITNETATLTKRNLRTGEETLLAEEIACYGIHLSDYHTASFSSTHLLLPCWIPPTNGSLNATNTVYAIHLETGEQTEISLKDESGSGYTFLGAVGNHYYVSTGIKEANVRFPNADGTYYTMTVGVSEYASLTTEEFMNSINNPVVFR